jgi:uncharacterized membrane protein
MSHSTLRGRTVARSGSVLAAVVLWTANPCGTASAFAVDPVPTFSSHVRPLLEAKCVRCHGASKKGGGLDCRTRESLLKGGVTGPAFVPGKSGKSLMVDLVRFNEMPPKKEQPRVTPEEQTLLKTWIDAGAP